jgi:arginine decarboxylase
MLTIFLTNVKNMAEEPGLPEPKIIFELGSFIVGDAGMILLKIMGYKQNDSRTKWGIVDGGLMALVPDMLISEKSFEILVANNANLPTERIMLGDITCDHDGIYPTEEMIKKGITGVLVPKVDTSQDWPLIVVINETGAYQDALSGKGGGQHCLLPEKATLIYKRGKDGLMHVRVFPRQSSKELRKIYGYHSETI